MNAYDGILAAILTPMIDDEAVNHAELRRQVNRLIGAGVHGLMVLGTNGEFYALSLDEKIAVLSTVIDECDGRVPVFAGTGCVTTAETVRLSRTAAEIGADAVSLVTPYFAAVSQDELYEHYRAVADAVSIPVVLYNIPKRTGTPIDPATVERLSSLDRIVGVKDSSGDFETTLAYIERTPDEFQVFAGADSLILATLLAGGAGAVSGLANVIPEIMVRIYDRWKSGDLDGARAAQESVRPLRRCLELGNPNSIVKRAVNLIGHPVGPARMPVYGLPSSVDGRLTEALERLGYRVESRATV